MIPLVKKTILFSFLLLLTACIKQETNDSLVPYVRVDFSVTPAFIPLQGTFYVTNGQGYNANGVVLFNNGNNNFRAFDLTCPTECLTAMSIDTNGTLTGKTCDNKEINFLKGIIKYTHNETTYYLKEYYVTYQGGVVRITN